MIPNVVDQEGTSIDEALPPIPTKSEFGRRDNHLFLGNGFRDTERQLVELQIQTATSNTPARLHSPSPPKKTAWESLTRARIAFRPIHTPKRLNPDL
jgi:hypothetical protein